MKRKLNYTSKAYSNAIMEDCIAADLGYYNDKNFVETKACELTVREQFEKAPFNVRFCGTNDGLEVGVQGAEGCAGGSGSEEAGYTYRSKTEDIMNIPMEAHQFLEMASTLIHKADVLIRKQKK